MSGRSRKPGLRERLLRFYGPLCGEKPAVCTKTACTSPFLAQWRRSPLPLPWSYPHNHPSGDVLRALKVLYSPFAGDSRQKIGKAALLCTRGRVLKYPRCCKSPSHSVFVSLMPAARTPHQQTMPTASVITSTHAPVCACVIPSPTATAPTAPVAPVADTSDEGRATA